MLANLAGEGRRLYDRGPAAIGLIVDDDGASLGPRYPLVERRDGSCTVINSDEAGLLLRTVFEFDDDPAPFVKYDGCNAANGNMEDAKAAGLEKFMVDPGHWQDWFRGAKSMEEQMKRQAANSNGRHVDWYFAERQVADYFREAAIRLNLSNVSVFYVPATAP